MGRILKTLLLLLISLNVAGQLTPATDQYILNPQVINPACAGNRGVLNISAFYRKQWVGVNGAPSTVTLSIDAPVLDDRIGLGLILGSDKIGVSKENQLITNYAYRLNIGKGVLSLGFGAGIITTNTEWSELETAEQGDEFYLVDSHPFIVPQFNFGSFYSNRNFFAGFSIPRLFSYKFDFDKSKYQVMSDPDLYNYMLFSGYDFDISRGVKIMPSLLLSYTASSRLLYDINAHVSFSDRFLVGASYRNNRSIGGLFQIRINNQFRIAYIYDYETSMLGKYSNGSHNICLRYEFRYKVEAVNSLIF